MPSLLRWSKWTPGLFFSTSSFFEISSLRPFESCSRKIFRPHASQLHRVPANFDRKSSLWAAIYDTIEGATARMSCSVWTGFHNNYSGYVSERTAAFTVTSKSMIMNQIIDAAFRNSLFELSLPQNSLIRFFNGWSHSILQSTFCSRIAQRIIKSRRPGKSASENHVLILIYEWYTNLYSWIKCADNSIDVHASEDSHGRFCFAINFSLHHCPNFQIQKYS